MVDHHIRVEIEKRLHRVIIEPIKNDITCKFSKNCDKAENCDRCNIFFQKCFKFAYFDSVSSSI